MKPSTFSFYAKALIPLLLLCLAGVAGANVGEYRLGAGDVVRISVFQNPDLTTEARVSESGKLTFPLVGSVDVGGEAIADAEEIIANRLREGGFVLKPHVTILPIEMRGTQVVVLGEVNLPGRFPLETSNQRLADALAAAGGISEEGADTVVLSGTRGGKPLRMEVDVAALFLEDDLSSNVPLAGGDVVYVHRAPVFYIYGEVQNPGVFRLERDMSLIQGLATGGGLTQRGTMRGLRVHRRDEQGELQILEAGLDDRLQANDVIHIRESLF